MRRRLPRLPAAAAQQRPLEATRALSADPTLRRASDWRPVWPARGQTGAPSRSLGN